MKELFSIMFLVIGLGSFASDREKQIRRFVEEELKYYPEARLTDLYKNYFQDAYGPGHLIPDTIRAGAYLDWELGQPDMYLFSAQLMSGGEILRFSGSGAKALIWCSYT